MRQAVEAAREQRLERRGNSTRRRPDHRARARQAARGTAGCPRQRRRPRRARRRRARVLRGAHPGAPPFPRLPAVAAPACRPPTRGVRRAAPVRARQTSVIGAPVLQPTRYSTRSRNVGSAQWTSSSTTSSGCSRASVSRSLRVAQKTSPLSTAAAPDERVDQSRRRLLAVRLPVEQRMERRTDLLAARDLFDDLGERQVGRALGVGDAAAGEDARLLRERPGELGGEPRLADPRLAEHDDPAAGGRCGGLAHGKHEPLELGPATDERRVGAPRDRRRALDELDEPVPALGRLRPRRAGRLRGSGRPEQDLPLPRALLHPPRGRQRPTREDATVLADEHLARLHRGPHRKGRKRVAELHRRPERRGGRRPHGRRGARRSRAPPPPAAARPCRRGASTISSSDASPRETSPRAASTSSSSSTSSSTMHTATTFRASCAGRSTTSAATPPGISVGSSCRIRRCSARSSSPGSIPDSSTIARRTSW